MIDVPRFKLDTELVRTLPPNVQPGVKLYLSLRNDATLRSDLFPFLYPVETNTPETANYYTVIDRPMCFTKIESRLEELSYFSTPEIVGDIRLILENCYRFNGPSSWVSRMACKVEMALEGRIRLLPFSVREKCCLSETSPHLTLYKDVCGRRSRVPRMFGAGSKSPIMLALEERELYRGKEVEIEKEQDKRRKEQATVERAEKLHLQLSNNKVFQRICESWELISSSLMVCVCQEVFNIAFTVSELELAILYPRHSEYLAKLMTAICAPERKIKEIANRSKDQSVASYEEWNAMLRTRVGFWYERTSKLGLRTTQNKWGVTNEFYELFGVEKPAEIISNKEGTNTGNETTDTTIKTENNTDTNCGDGSGTTKPNSEDGSVVKDLCNGGYFHDLSIGERLALVHCLCTSKVVSDINPWQNQGPCP
eukprot:sb/3464973/